MSYLNHYLKGKNIKSIVTKANKMLKHLDFTHIAVRGNSGLLIGAPLAQRMGKDLLIVRKDTENSHSSYAVEGDRSNTKILIVDDFIASGRTLKEIKKEINDNCFNPSFVAIFLYADGRNNEVYASLPVYCIPRDKYKNK